MIEGEFLRVQHRSLRPETRANTAVGCVPHDRMTDRRQVHTNLVRASRFETTLDQRGVLGFMERALHRVVGS